MSLKLIRMTRCVDDLSSGDYDGRLPVAIIDDFLRIVGLIDERRLLHIQWQLSVDRRGIRKAGLREGEPCALLQNNTKIGRLL